VKDENGDLPDPSCLEVETAIPKLKRCKSPGSNTILEELMQAGGETILSAIHKLILFGIRKNCLISGRSLLLYEFGKRVLKVTNNCRCDRCARMTTPPPPVSRLSRKCRILDISHPYGPSLPVPGITFCHCYLFHITFYPLSFFQGYVL
jgi:hypothetical protein